MEEGQGSRAPVASVVCILGTDHHHFDRLVAWCDTLATRLPQVDVLVQHGASAPPRTARGVPFLGKQELEDALMASHVAICHGGPGSISDVRAAGLLPLVLPRDPQLGEHVDGHQQRFVRRYSGTGAIVEVGTEDHLVSLVEAALSEPRGSGRQAHEEVARVGESVQRFAELVDRLLAQPRSPR